MSGCLQRFALPHAASQCSLNASAMKREHEYNNISTYWRREAPRHLATCAEGSLDQQGVPVAVVPGTTFNIEAGRNHVLINHAQGWRDTATLQVRAYGTRGAAGLWAPYLYASTTFARDSAALSVGGVQQKHTPERRAEVRLQICMFRVQLLEDMRGIRMVCGPTAGGTGTGSSSAFATEGLAVGLAAPAAA